MKNYKDYYKQKLVEQILLEFDPNRGKSGRSIPLATSFLDAKKQGLPGTERGNFHKKFHSLSPEGQGELRAFYAGRRFERSRAETPREDKLFYRGKQTGRHDEVQADARRQDMASSRASFEKPGAKHYSKDPDLDEMIDHETPVPETGTERLRDIKRIMDRK